MGLRRAATALFLIILALVLVPVISLAQGSVDEVGREKQEADSLVSVAVANRDQIETELVGAMERYQEVSDQMARLGASVDRLRNRIEAVSRQVLSASEAAVEDSVNAYMEGVAYPSVALLGTVSLQEALVAQLTLQLLSGENEDDADDLAANQHALESLQASHRAEVASLVEVERQSEAAAAHLQELFARADVDVAVAIQAARAADTRYRAALDAVDRARAAQEEQDRQDQRQTTPTPDPGTVTNPTGGQPSAKSIKANTELWRTLVASYFPAEQVDPALRIIQCESLGDPNAYNPYSGASGLFQFLPGTWAVMAPKAGFAGASVFEPEANVAAAAWMTSYYAGLGKNPWAAWYCRP